MRRFSKNSCDTDRRFSKNSCDTDGRNGFGKFMHPRNGFENDSTWSEEDQQDTAEDYFWGATGASGAPTKNGMFIDAASMKEKLRQNICKPEYNVADFYHPAGFFRYLATHKIFEGATLVVIAFNALYISLDTDYNESDSLLGASPIFQLAEHFFCTYFSFEWFVRFMAFKKKRNGCRDAWFVFDTIMVTMMVLETWVMTVIMLLTGAAGSGGMGNASILRLMRLLRLTRMARMARLLRAMPELMILIKGMLAATRSVFFTMLLLFLVLYLFGIMFTQLLVDTPVGRTRFSSVPMSMHTLLVDGTLLDSVEPVVTALSDESFVYPVLFYIFVLLSALTVLNMLIGILCGVVCNVAAIEKEVLTITYVRERLEAVVNDAGIDENGDGEISREEFCQILTNPRATELLQEVGIDVCGLIDVADFVYEEHAEEDDTGEKKPRNLTFAEFMAVLLQLRGNNKATVKEIVDLRKFVSKVTQSVEDRLDRTLSAQQARIQRMSSQRVSMMPRGDMSSTSNNYRRSKTSSSSLIPEKRSSRTQAWESQQPRESRRSRTQALEPQQPPESHSSLRSPRWQVSPRQEGVSRLKELLNSSEAELSRLLREVGQLIPKQQNHEALSARSEEVQGIGSNQAGRPTLPPRNLTSLRPMEPREAWSPNNEFQTVQNIRDSEELAELASKLRHLQAVLAEDGLAVANAIEDDVALTSPRCFEVMDNSCVIVPAPRPSRLLPVIEDNLDVLSVSTPSESPAMSSDGGR